MYRINRDITAKQVRVVGDESVSGIYPTETALRMAENRRLDLVEIAPKAEPPVCRIVDFSKFKYEQKRKLKEIKAKSKVAPLKEIRFSPDTEEHDFVFKLKHAESFLDDGSKVRVFVHFKGRSIVYKERGEALLMRFAQELESRSKVDEMPRMEGKRMYILLTPKSKNN